LRDQDNRRIAVFTVLQVVDAMSCFMLVLHPEIVTDFSVSVLVNEKFRSRYMRHHKSRLEDVGMATHLSASTTSSIAFRRKTV